MIVETENSGFTLLMSRAGDPFDHMKVYYDDEEILKGSRSEEIISTLSNVKNDLTGDALSIYNGILAAIEKSI